MVVPSREILRGPFNMLTADPTSKITVPIPLEQKSVEILITSLCKDPMRKLPIQLTISN